MDRLDHALSELPRHDASEWAIAEVLQRVSADSGQAEETPPAAPSRSSSRHIVAWACLAAGLAVGAAIWMVASPEGDSISPVVSHSGMTLKGAGSNAPDPTINLGLSLLRADVPVALVPGASARATDTVLLRYTTDASGFVYLFRFGAEQDFEVFHGTPTLPGTHHVTVDGRIVGYELEGLSGKHTFGVAFSRDPWAPGVGIDAATAPEDLATALAGRGAFPRTIGDITVDARSVRMDPEGR